ncbi:MAG: hypothetical protein QG596_798 [Actinomycetota bacterium]|jgi:hypothetical protein|nr:hypothetical protein [Actinomycetota bacterium]
MSISNGLSAAYGLARVGFGIFAASSPKTVGRTWIGADADRPRVEVLLRALGFRDIALGAGITEGALRGNATGWLAVAMLCDLGDMSATLIGRKNLDQQEAIITAALTSGGAIAAAILLLAERSEI